MTNRSSRPHCGRSSSADMEIEIAGQALVLLLALLTGAGTGLIYDLLRPLRRRSGRAGSAVLDVLFALCAGTAAFVFAMSAPGGRLGMWELTLILAGFIAYMYTLSSRIYPVAGSMFELLLRLFGQIKKFYKKTAEMAKFLFQKVRECFIIKND